MSGPSSYMLVVWLARSSALPTLNGSRNLEFASINVEGMNETDVRETIVRPFIHALGYAYGTPNHIRTEYPLRYGKTFLGRKNPSKDPDLRGRADYICEVVSHGRWV